MVDRRVLRDVPAHTWVGERISPAAENVERRCREMGSRGPLPSFRLAILPTRRFAGWQDDQAALRRRMVEHLLDQPAEVVDRRIVGRVAAPRRVATVPGIETDLVPHEGLPEGLVCPAVGGPKRLRWAAAGVSSIEKRLER